MSEIHQDKWPEMRMKHLELIQNAIGRMAEQSASLKNYCMTIVAGVIGLGAAVNKPLILMYGIPMIILFAILDANYLRLERGFRSLFDEVRKEALDKAPNFRITYYLELDRLPPVACLFAIGHSLFSWSVLGFYLPVIALMGTIYYIM